MADSSKIKLNNMCGVRIDAHGYHWLKFLLNVRDIIENRELPCRQLYRPWRHWRLSLWRPPVLPVAIKFANFRFSMVGGVFYKHSIDEYGLCCHTDSDKSMPFNNMCQNYKSCRVYIRVRFFKRNVNHLPFSMKELRYSNHNKTKCFMW